MSRNTVIAIALACLLAGVGVGFLIQKTAPLKIDIERPTPSAVPVESPPSVVGRAFTEETSSFSVNVEYPELQGIANSSAREGTNAKIKQDVYEHIAGFRAANSSAAPVEGLRSMFSGRYTVALLSRSFFSGTISYSDYSAGAAHPNNYLVTVNYDLRTGETYALDRFLKALNPQSGYFERLSQYVIQELTRKIGPTPEDVQIIKDGAAPTAENYQNYTVDKEGLTVIFNPYQVGPYALGAPEVKIPYGVLFSSILKSAADPGARWWLG